jgi:hypothetical protein
LLNGLPVRAVVVNGEPREHADTTKSQGPESTIQAAECQQPERRTDAGEEPPVLGNGWEVA